MTEQLPIEKIAPNPRNPRERFDDEKIDQLATSIERQGLLDPVTVRPRASYESPDGEFECEYELVIGERRLRAVQRLGWKTIEAIVRDLSDQQSLELAITENLQREDVSPIEEARGYKQLIEEHDLTQAEAADRLGVSRSHISNQLGLLKLPAELQEYVLRKTLSPWQARTLASVWDDYRLLDLVLDHDLSVAALREIITELQEKDDGSIRVPSSVPPAAMLDTVVSVDELEELGFNDEEIGDIRMRDLIEYQIWASQQAELDVTEPSFGRGFEVHPVVYHADLGKVIHGSVRIERAVEEGYEGEVDIECWYPRRHFAADRFEIESGADGSKGERA